MMEREVVPVNRGSSASSFLSLRRLQGIAARLFPHQNARTVCPPGPIPTGPLPPIIVSSLMRSGTHLTIDLLLNNIPGYRQNPLFIDYDTYVYEGYSPSALLGTGSTIVKTHIIQRPFTATSTGILHQLGRRGLVIIPERNPAKIMNSMNRWGYQTTEAEILLQHRRQLDFWENFDPIVVRFEDVLDSEKSAALLRRVRERLGLPEAPSGQLPVVAGSSRPLNLWRKLRSRLQGSAAPVINTTVGFKL